MVTESWKQVWRSTSALSFLGLLQMKRGRLVDTDDRPIYLLSCSYYYFQLHDVLVFDESLNDNQKSVIMEKLSVSNLNWLKSRLIKMNTRFLNLLFAIHTSTFYIIFFQFPQL